MYIYICFVYISVKNLRSLDYKINTPTT